MAKSQKNVVVANTENTDEAVKAAPVEQEMSQQQEAILNNVETEGNTEALPFDTEGMLVPVEDSSEPMTQDVKPPEPVRLGELDAIEPTEGQILNAESLESQYAEGTIDESALIEAVERNDILPSQYKAIVGEDYTGRDDTSNFQAYKMDLEARLNEGKLNAAGAFLQIDSWLRAEKISPDEATKLREYLGEKDTSSTPKKKEIMEHFVPEHLQKDHLTAEDITTAYASLKVDAANWTSDIITADNENESNRTANITSIFADYAFLKMLENKLPASSSMPALLWDYIVSEQVLGKPRDPEKDTNGADIPGTGYDPYRDKTVLAYAKPAATKACLLAYGSVTGVTFGYISKEHATGKRFDPRMVFVEKPNTPVEDCFRAVCVPAKTIRPYIWKNEEHTTIQEGREVTGWQLVPVKPNDDDTLRYLTTQNAQALHLHYFDDQELEYDVISLNNKKMPTGLLIGSKKPGTPSSVEQAAAIKAQNTQGRTTGGSQDQVATPAEIIKSKDAQIAALEEDRRAALNAREGDILTMLHATSALVRERGEAFPKAEQIAILTAATEVVLRTIMPSTRLPDPEQAMALAKIIEAVSKICLWDDDYHFTTVDGSKDIWYEIDVGKNTIKEVKKHLRSNAA